VFGHARNSRTGSSTQANSVIYMRMIKMILNYWVCMECKSSGGACSTKSKIEPNCCHKGLIPKWENQGTIVITGPGVEL